MPMPRHDTRRLRLLGNKLSVLGVGYKWVIAILGGSRKRRQTRLTKQRKSMPQIALITGASRGLGRNMALHLAKRGVHIIGTYRSGAAEAETLKQEIETLGGKAAMLPLDITDTASYQDFSSALTETLKTHFGHMRTFTKPAPRAS